MTNRPMIYITRDIERALGIEPNPSYKVITNRTPYSEKIQEKYPEYITLIESPNKKILSTSELIEKSNVIADTDIVVFKNTLQIEEIAKQKHCNILNPKSALAEKIENKITQTDWLGELAKKYLPEYSICPLNDVAWKNTPFVLQWAHGHTGDSTMLIENQKQLSILKEKFPGRIFKKSVFVDGPSFTVNIVIAGNNILMGNTSYQITGMKPLTDNIFSTVGNDWRLTRDILDQKQYQHVEKMIDDIGNKMIESGWKGLFGIDFMLDSEQNQIFLIEINARQPASAVFESFLQNKNREQGTKGITIFEAHIKALSLEKINGPIIKINDGAQLVMRITKDNQDKVREKSKQELEKAGYNTIIYNNIAINADLIRAQSIQGLMEKHNVFNTKGQNIINTLKT